MVSSSLIQVPCLIEVRFKVIRAAISHLAFVAAKAFLNPQFDISSIIFPVNHASTTQFVFGQEKSLFPHPTTRNINHGKSKEIKLSASYPVAKKQNQGGWVGKKLLEVEKQCDRFESDRYNV